MYRLVKIIVLVLFISVYVNSYSVEIESGQKECFIVTATPGIIYYYYYYYYYYNYYYSGTPITGSFEVIHPDPKHISVTAYGPTEYLHFEKKAVEDLEKVDREDASEGFFSFDADIEGDYTMCIQNGSESESDGVDRLVAFNFRAVKVGEQDYQFVGLQSELADLKEGLALLRDHQSYMNQREDVHKSSLESINVKVLCWTVLEAIILVAMALWQITYIRSFFETKRRL